MSDLPGLFVTIEGIEGAGKSTLASALAYELRLLGFKVVVTAEPGGGEVGDSIRRILLNSANIISDKAELLLFEAARAQHVDSKILPALGDGSIVICDRFTDSTIAYQGYARGIDINTIKWLNEYATSGLIPNVTILLDLPTKTGIGRQIEIDRVSSQAIAFHEIVRNAYLSLAKAEPDRIIILDATKDLDEVKTQASGVIRMALDGRNKV